MIKPRWLLAAVFLGVSAFAYAAMDESPVAPAAPGGVPTLPGVPGAAAPEVDPLVTPIVGSSLWLGDKVDAAPAFALRFGLPCSEDFSYLCPTGRWSVELGTIFQHQASGDFQSDSRAEDGNTWRAQLRSYYEVHVSALTDLPHGKQKWAVPEAGFGFSVQHMVNHVDYLQTNPPPTFPETANVIRSPVSPLFIFGVRCLALGPLTLGVDFTYAWYTNKFDWRGQEFDFSMKGVAVRPSLMLRL